MADFLDMADLGEAIGGLLRDIAEALQGTTE
jgi:hypothetical protein